jgi:hypothetical protein
MIMTPDQLRRAIQLTAQPEHIDQSHIGRRPRHLASLAGTLRGGPPSAQWNLPARTRRARGSRRQLVTRSATIAVGSRSALNPLRSAAVL